MSNNEKPKRLKPTQEVLRKLYLYSGNLCAFPDCDRVMINQDGVMTGRICHIQAAEPGGKRFNKKMTNEERRGFENLVLMCGDHHTIIDSNSDKFSTKRIKEIKSKHEAKFSEIGSTLKRSFTSQFEDNTDSIETTRPSQLSKFLKHFPSNFGPGDVPDVVEHLEDYISKLEKTPLQHREFLLAAFQRAEKLGTEWHGSAAVSVDDLSSALNLSQTKLKREGDALERYQLGYISERDYRQYWLRLSDPSDYLTLWDLSYFSQATGHSLREFLIDVNFGLLD